MRDGRSWTGWKWAAAVLTGIGAITVWVFLSYSNRVIDGVIKKYCLVNGKTSAETVFPEEFDLPCEEVILKTEEGALIKTWFIAGDIPQICIIVNAGYLGNRTQLLPAAKFFYAWGYSTFLMDARGQGENGGVFGFGAFYKKDIELAMRTFETKGFTSFVLLGYSAGATGSILAGAGKENVLAVIADSPFANLSTLTFAPNSPLNDVPRIFLSFFHWLLARKTEAKLGINPFLLTDALGAVGKVKNLFLIHGERDKVVPPFHSEVLYQKAQSGIPGIKRLWIIPEADHIEAWQRYPDEYQNRILSFLQECLSGY